MSNVKRKPIAEFDLSKLEGGALLELPLAGLPGFRNLLTLQIYYDDPNHELHQEVQGSKGEYKVVFTLSRPGVSLSSDSDSYFISENLEGNSHLAIAKPAHPHPDSSKVAIGILKSKIHNKELTFICSPNSKGFLGKIELETIEANNYTDATLTAVRGILPVLSEISYRYDVPLNIYQIDAIEVKTKSRIIVTYNKFKETPFWNEKEREFNKDFLKYASYYREGLTSNSISYQFLCYYKIIEGIRARRSRIIEEARREKREIPEKLKERIPTTGKEKKDWLNSLFIAPQEWDEMALNSVFINEIENKSIGNLISKQSELHKLRLKIAHSILDNDEPALSIDDVIDVEHLHKWLPVAKFIARYLLNREFPDKYPDNTSKPVIVKLYKSKSFTARKAEGHKRYDHVDGSLEYVRDISAQTTNGKIELPPMNFDIVKDNIGMDFNGDPNIIFVGMEVHNDGTEHHLFTGFVDLSDSPSVTFNLYGKESSNGTK